MSSAAIRVLVRRDLLRFFRQRSRVVGALGQPLIFWLVIGGGLAGSFRIPGAADVGYVQYFYPGVIALVVLFTSIFTTMSVIEDRQGGFLQAVLVAPTSRPAIVLGKTLGGVAIALVQALIFLALAPLAGFSLGAVDWPITIAALLLTSVALSSLGFALAWWLNSTQGYHVVMSVLLIPMWVLSGAMFPPQGAHGVIAALMRCNPIAYSVAALRRGLYGPAYPAISAQVGFSHSSTALELTILAAFALGALALAARLCAKRT